MSPFLLGKLYTSYSFFNSMVRTYILVFVLIDLYPHPLNTLVPFLAWPIFFNSCTCRWKVNELYLVRYPVALLRYRIYLFCNCLDMTNRSVLSKIIGFGNWFLVYIDSMRMVLYLTNLFFILLIIFFFSPWNLWAFNEWWCISFAL